MRRASVDSNDVRNYPTDENRAFVVAQVSAKSRGLLLSSPSCRSTTDYGRSAIEFTQEYLPEFKGEILTEDYYKEGEVDFRSVLAKIRDSGRAGDHHVRLGDTNADHCSPNGRTRPRRQSGRLSATGNSIPRPRSTSAPTALEGAVEAAAWSCPRGTRRKARHSWRIHEHL